MMQKHYIAPRTEIVFVLQTASILSSSGERTTPIGGGDTQTNAW